VTVWLPERLSLQKSIHKIMSLPDYVTCLNLICGLLSIYAAIHQRFVAAALLLLTGVALDMLDGYLARRLKLESNFGAELDSLSDLVTFGVAPMVLIMGYYQLHWLSILAISLPVFGALRLARHNINRHFTKGYLIGLPITTAGVVIPFIIILSLNEYAAATSIIGLSVFYVSTRRVNKIVK
jgi:CDP-diacylglycerol---serine O-phosphatidyltransferase